MHSNVYIYIDRYFCLKSYYIRDNQEWPDLAELCDNLMIFMKFDDTKRGFVGAKLFCMEHVLPYPRQTFVVVLRP